MLTIIFNVCFDMNTVSKSAARCCDVCLCRLVPYLREPCQREVEADRRLVWRHRQYLQSHVWLLGSVPYMYMYIQMSLPLYMYIAPSSTPVRTGTCSNATLFSICVVLFWLAYCSAWSYTVMICAPTCMIQTGVAPEKFSLSLRGRMT